jgi:hypothetical protein
MRRIDVLSKAQRIVVVIALGLAFWVVGSYLTSVGTGGYPLGGWTGYAPSSEGQFFVVARWSPALHPWLRVIIWLVLIGIWALASLRVLRPSPEKTEPR